MDIWSRRLMKRKKLCRARQISAQRRSENGVPVWESPTTPLKTVFPKPDCRWRRSCTSHLELILNRAASKPFGTSSCIGLAISPEGAVLANCPLLRFNTDGDSCHRRFRRRSESERWPKVSKMAISTMTRWLLLLPPFCPSCFRASRSLREERSSTRSSSA